ncbi:hypothetical protein [Listeria newyorkensis]|uniref:hypothetical protein n=1 Tax=Listeria newyorkensis TaxID=1497681 RepID=UPI00051D36E1|nr:hypothetical protein [Listeria newyorkensis]KGL45737.1 hypothetical protein EP58_03350 [Listeria newyorkensis]SQC55324.1 Uncharacterised protein [Listeria newyorkensis]SQC55621.1 Uncharacterised protein [Listeria newyorkensis]
MKQLVDLIREFGSADIIEISRNLNMQIIDFNLNKEIDAILTCIDNHTRILTCSAALTNERKQCVLSYIVNMIILEPDDTKTIILMNEDEGIC